MATAYELMMSAPDTQATRAKLIYKAIAVGEWADAAHYLENAISEEGNSKWGLDAAALLNQCATKSK